MTILIIFIYSLVAVGFVRIFFVLRKNEMIFKVRDKMQKEVQYLSFLTASATSETESLEKSFPHFLNILKETVGWTYHSIFQLDEANQVLPIRFTGYLPDWYMEEMSTKVKVKVGDVAIGRCVATRQPATINSAKVDPRFMDVTSLIRQVGFQSLTCCPLLGRLKVHGGFCTYSEFKNIFKLHDTQFFLTCANIYTAIIETNLLNKRVALFK